MNFESVSQELNRACKPAMPSEQGSHESVFTAVPNPSAQVDQQQKESGVDRLADSIANKVTYYLDAPDQLYKPYLFVSMLMSAYHIGWSVWSWVRLSEAFQYLDAGTMKLMGTGMAFTAFSVVNAALGFLLVVPTLSRLKRKNASGVTLLATIVVLHLLRFEILMFFLGVGLFVLPSFKKAVSDFAPEWYSKLVKSFE